MTTVGDKVSIRWQSDGWNLWSGKQWRVANQSNDVLVACGTGLAGSGWRYGRICRCWKKVGWTGLLEERKLPAAIEIVQRGRNNRRRSSWHWLRVAVVRRDLNYFPKLIITIFAFNFFFEFFFFIIFLVFFLILLYISLIFLFCFVFLLLFNSFYVAKTLMVRQRNSNCSETLELQQQ